MFNVELTHHPFSKRNTQLVHDSCISFSWFEIRTVRRRTLVKVHHSSSPTSSLSSFSVEISSPSPKYRRTDERQTSRFISRTVSLLYSPSTKNLSSSRVNLANVFQHPIPFVHTSQSVLNRPNRTSFLPPLSSLRVYNLLGICTYKCKILFILLLLLQVYLT